MKNNDYEPLEQRLFQMLIEGTRERPNVTLMGVEDGFEVVLRHDDNLYKLYTQRKKARVFRSVKTAVVYVIKMGAERVTIEGLNSWRSEAANSLSGRLQ